MSQDFFGTGPAYPFVRSGGGNFLMASGRDLVEMGFTQALRTQIGQRPMFKGIGNMINRIIFMLEGSERDELARQFLDEAIFNFEPRISILSVKVDDSEDDPRDVFINIEWDYLNESNPRNTIIPMKRGG